MSPTNSDFTEFEAEHRIFPHCPLPERVLKYKKRSYEEQYLVRWKGTLVPGPDLQLYTYASRPALENVFQLRPIHSECFINVTPQFTPEAPYYFVLWRDSWVCAADLSPHADLIIEFWTRPYTIMRRCAVEY